MDVKVQQVSQPHGPSDDIDLYQILEQLDQSEASLGRHGTAYGFTPAYNIDADAPFTPMHRQQDVPPDVKCFLDTPLAAAAREGRHEDYFSQAAEDILNRHATYPMADSGQHLRAGAFRGFSMGPSAEAAWKQGPFWPRPQHEMQCCPPQGPDLPPAGSLLISSTSLDAEDSAATATAAAAGSPQERSAWGRKHRSEQWRVKNCQAQKTFRLKQKEKWKSKELRLQELSQQVRALQQRRQQLQAALDAAAQNQRSPATKGGLVLSLELAHVALTEADMEALTVDDLAELWKNMTRKMGIYLPEAQRHPIGDMARRAEALAGEAMQLLWALAEVNPRVLTAFEGANLELRGLEPQHGNTPWESVLEQLQLTQQQVVSMRAAHDMLHGELRELLDKRKALVSRLQGLCIGAGGLELKEARRVMQQMGANVAAAFACKFYFVSHAWSKILSPLQRASFIVLSYPFGADMLSLMATAARGCGSADAGNLEDFSYSKMTADSLAAPAPGD